MLTLVDDNDPVGDIRRFEHEFVQPKGPLPLNTE